MRSSSPMKWFALLLLAGNAGLAFWGWSVIPDSRLPQAAGTSTINPVILLNELTPAEQNRLASELEAQRVLDRALNNLSEIRVETQPLPGSGCYLFSLPDQQSLRAFYSRIESLAPNSYLGERVEQRPGAIMLYVPPLPSFRLAQIELDSLRAAGVDGFIIPDGDMANGISVGVFNSEQNIQERTDQIEALGYNLQRYQYMVDRPVYAVNVPVLSFRQIDEQLWSEIEQNFPGISSQQNSCWEVASTLNFN